LSGAATKLASCFVGLNKRYVTDVDLSARTSTGDPEGEVIERLEPPDEQELAQKLEALRGEIELPIPSASAVKIGGERAYRLHRRGVEVEMPVRRSRVNALDVIAYRDGVARLDLRVSSGTYVRAIAEALGGHCATLRRTEVGPFTVEEADPERIVPPDEALARIGLAPRAARELRDEGRPRSGRAGGSAARVAVGTFDGVHLGHRRVLETALSTAPALTPAVVTFWPHPRTVLGNEVRLVTTLERRLELLAEAGVEETLVVGFTLELARMKPDAFVDELLRPIGTELVVAGADFRFGRGRAR